MKEGRAMKKTGKKVLLSEGMLISITGILFVGVAIFNLFKLCMLLWYKGYGLETELVVGFFENIVRIPIGAGYLVVGILGIKNCNNLEKSTMCIVLGAILTFLRGTRKQIWF